MERAVQLNAPILENRQNHPVGKIQVVERRVQCLWVMGVIFWPKHRLLVLNRAICGHTQSHLVGNKQSHLVAPQKIIWWEYRVVKSRKSNMMSKHLDSDVLSGFCGVNDLGIICQR